MADQVHAKQILNWAYLSEIARYIEQPRNWAEAVRQFAYLITNIESTEDQDRMLKDLLMNSTYLQSAESNEKVIASLARSTGCRLDALREFAKQVGVRLRRDA